MHNEDDSPQGLSFRGATKFFISAWIRYYDGEKKICSICKQNTANFSSASYGYEGIQDDISALEAQINTMSGGEEEEHSFHSKMYSMERKIHEAQQNGTYLVVGTTYHCIPCLIDLIEAFLAQDLSIRPVILNLLLEAGKVSCVIGWKIPLGLEDFRFPFLQCTRAETREAFVLSE